MPCKFRLTWNVALTKYEILKEPILHYYCLKLRVRPLRLLLRANQCEGPEGECSRVFEGTV
jgi:hypothetical protein